MYLFMSRKIVGKSCFHHHDGRRSRASSCLPFVVGFADCRYGVEVGFKLLGVLGRCLDREHEDVAAGLNCD